MIVSPSSFLYLITAVLNFIISIFLAQKYGAIGCAIGTAVSYIITQGVLMNVYYHKSMKINIVAFWKSILALSRGMIVPALVGGIIMKCITFYSIMQYMATIMLYSAVYCVSMWCFGMNAEEKQLALQPIQKLAEKRRQN